MFVPESRYIGNSPSGGPGELSPLRLVDPLSVGELTGEPGVQRLSWSLGPELILMTHRMVCFELPSRLIGRFRTEAVSVALPGGPSRPLVAPDEIPRSVQVLCADWAAEIAGAADEAARLDAIARFHHRFLAIHPFLDGNGRTARALLLQQCVDTFGRADMSRGRGQAGAAGVSGSSSAALLRNLAERSKPSAKGPNARILISTPPVDFPGHSCAKIEAYSIAQAGEDRVSPKIYVMGHHMGFSNRNSVPMSRTCLCDGQFADHGEGHRPARCYSSVRAAK